MEENENKKPDGTEGEKPEDNVTPTPEEKKDDKKNKVAAFFAPKRNKIIVGVSAAALIALIIGLSVGLSKCGSGNGGNGGDATSSSGSSSSSSEAHTHDYDAAWKYDATNHWHECKSGDGVKSDVAAHTFGSEIEIIDKATESKAGTKGYKCTVCDYAKDTFSYTPYISADTYQSAMSLDADKFTVVSTYDDGAGNSQSSVFGKDGDLAYQSVTRSSGTSEYYYSREGSAGSYSYYKYSKDSGDYWEKTSDDSDVFDSLSPYKLYLQDAYSYFIFSDFTFDESSLSYKGKITRNNGEEDVEINAELTFNNGKVTKGVLKYNGGTKTITVKETPDSLTLPSVHVHKVASGSLDLNGTTPKIKGTCSDCNKEVTKDYEATDTASVVTYGYYPQTHVSDATTIASLNALTSAESNGWYLLNGTYYAKVAAATPYGDSYSFSDGNLITANSSYWFKVEPIEWKAISSSDGQYSLASSLILDYQMFHSVRAANTNVYATSDLRTWLIGTFYNAVFSNDSSYLQAYTSDDLNDKVYLNSSGDQCRVSDYAKAIGAPLASGTEYGNYWTTALSSPMTWMATVAYGDGGYNYQDVNMKYGVRPAITVKVS